MLNSTKPSWLFWCQTHEFLRITWHQFGGMICREPLWMNCKILKKHKKTFKKQPFQPEMVPWYTINKHLKNLTAKSRNESFGIGTSGWVQHHHSVVHIEIQYQVRLLVSSQTGVVYTYVDLGTSIIKIHSLQMSNFQKCLMYLNVDMFCYFLMLGQCIIVIHSPYQIKTNLSFQ